MTKWIPLSLVLAGAIGCGPTISITDDLDLTWDFDLTPARFDDDLHTPYVKGAPVKLFVRSSDDHDNLSGWTVESSDDTVFRIDGVAPDFDHKGIVATGVAVGAGTAALDVFDSRHHHQGSGLAEVAAPDHVELDAHPYLIMGLDDQAPVNEARVLEGGTATYLVRYFNNGQELHGNSVLAVNTPTTLVAEPRTTFLFENREWLSLTAATPGPASVELAADGVSLGNFPVITVPETDIASVKMIAQSEAGAKDGQWLVVLAQSADAANRRIFGVDFTWDINGVEQTGEGDLY